MKFLKKLSKLLINHPMRMIFIALLVILLLGVGARNVNMATGNETLVSTDTDVYQDNKKLEEAFGGESITVLYEGEDLLTPNNLNHMKGLEDQLEQNNAIFSILSPVTLVEHMSTKQQENYQEGLIDMIDGLDEMGTKLKESGEKLTENSRDDSQTQLPDMESKMAELEDAFAKMTSGQKKLKAGTGQLKTGLAEYGKQTQEVGANLHNMSQEMKADQNPQARQLEQLGGQLMQLSQKMMQTSEKSATLSQIPDRTVNGLNNMEQGLSQQTGKLQNFQAEQKQQMEELAKLGDGLTEMGDNLISISKNMEKMIANSDTMKAGLPEKQTTLDHMIYTDDDQLRSSFEEIVIDDEYMLMIIKFEGNVDDTTKSDTVAAINNYMKENPNDHAEIMVSGKPVLDDSIRTSMKESMQKMMMLSVAFMIIVLSVVFKVSWRLLPLVVILVAVVGTVGLMGWLNIPITMVSMAVFPILIGLGIDYAIQFHSRYTEELREGADSYEE
ncbi:MMPL family transporter [Halobacillus sp. MO56]